MNWTEKKSNQGEWRWQPRRCLTQLFCRLSLSTPASKAVLGTFSRVVSIACLLCFATAVPAQQTNKPEFTEDGRRIVRLLDLCTSADTAICDSYIDGFVDGYWISNTHSFDMFPARKKGADGLSVRRMADRVFKRGICLPDGVRISTLRRVLVDYLQERKDEWQKVWYQNQLWGAFNREWPCRIDTEENTDTR